MNMKTIYRKIAKEYDVSVSEVKQEMQSAIDHAYSSTNISKTTETNKHPSTLTPEAFVLHTVQEYKKWASKSHL